jgi:hypothetical protein
MDARLQLAEPHADPADGDLPRRCIDDGEQLSHRHGSLEEFATFDEVLDSYRKQLKYWCDQMISMINKMDLCHQRMKPLPYLSLLVDDCIAKGAGRLLRRRRTTTTPARRPSGSAPRRTPSPRSVSSSLTKSAFSGAEFLHALAADWEGYEQLYALVNSEHMHNTETTTITPTSMRSSSWTPTATTSATARRRTAGSSSPASIP